MKVVMVVTGYNNDNYEERSGGWWCRCEGQIMVKTIIMIIMPCVNCYVSMMRV